MSDTHKESDWALEAVEGISPYSDEMRQMKVRLWNEIVLPEIEQEYEQLYPRRDWSKLSLLPGNKEYARYCREYWAAALAWKRDRMTVRQIEDNVYHLGIRSGYGHLSIDNFVVLRLTTNDLLGQTDSALKTCALLTDQLKRVRSSVGRSMLALWLVAVAAALTVLQPLSAPLIALAVFFLLTASIGTATEILDRLTRIER